jgi:hypothetical protein
MCIVDKRQLSRKCKQKPKESEDIKKRENQCIQNKMFKENTKELYRNLDTKNIDAKEPPINGSSRALLEISVGRKSTA